MSALKEDDLKMFLGRTRYCDWDHRSIQAVLAQVLDGGGSERAAAVKLFRFVRDEVLYAFGPWGVTASATLARREGTCTNKNNLLIALFRAAGIPAAYGVLRVDAREYFGNVAPPCFKPFGSTDSTHIYAAAYLRGRWVRCDSSTDREMAARTGHFCQQTRLIEWDGEHDAMDALDPVHIHADLGQRPSIDDLLDKPPHHATAGLFAVLNDYVRFIRSHPPFPSAEALLAAYRPSFDLEALRK